MLLHYEFIQNTEYSYTDDDFLLNCFMVKIQYFTI